MARLVSLSESEKKVFRVFCEAMTPPGGRLPGAEVDVPIVEPIAEFLAGVAPRTRRMLRLAIRIFDFTPLVPGFWQGRPRRFSRSSPAERTRHLERIDRSRLPGLHDLLLLLKTLAMVGYTRDARVQEAIGYAPTCAVRKGFAPPEPQPRPLDRTRMSPPLDDVVCDVAIVGSGAGGAVAAHVLAQAGLDVAVLEEGAYHDRSSYERDPLKALPALYRDSGLTVCEGAPIIPLPVGRCVGGTTVINSGTCFRAPEPLLETWRGDHGIPWASAAELEEAFDRFERELLVEPVDVETMGRNGQLCMEGARALRASGGPISRYADGCVTCGTCPTGCAIDAKQATHVSYLPRAMAAGAQIFERCHVERIVRSEGRGARALDVAALDERDRVSHRFKVSARTFVIGAGALGTPELLMRSGIEHPRGLIGRGLRIHPACWVGALYPETVRGWDGIMQSYYVDEWHDRGLLMEATFTPIAFGGQWMMGIGAEHKRRLEQYDRLGSIGVHLSDRSRGRVRLDRRGRLRVGYRLQRDDTRRLLYGIARAADLHFAAGALEVYPQITGLPLIRPGEQRRVEGGRPRASALHLEAFHPMGTCRMGADPADSVVAPSGEVHGLPNVYVADASLFPTSLGVNPMLTIMAFADKIVRGIAQRLV